MKVYIHVNQHVIRRNAREHTSQPPVTLRTKSRVLARCSELCTHGDVRLVYAPDTPLRCGARVYLECDLSQVEILR